MNHPIFPYIYYSTCSRLSSDPMENSDEFRFISSFEVRERGRNVSINRYPSNSVLISQIFAKTTTGFRLADFSHLSIAHKFEAGSVSEFGCTTFPADMVFAMSLWVWNGATAHSYKTIQHTHGHACGWCGGVFHTPLLRHLKIAVSTSIYDWKSVILTISFDIETKLSLFLIKNIAELVSRLIFALPGGQGSQSASLTRQLSARTVTRPDYSELSQKYSYLWQWCVISITAPSEWILKLVQNWHFVCKFMARHNASRKWHTVCQINNLK